MLSTVECKKDIDHGFMNFVYDAYGSYFSCTMCGSSRGAACPHCDAASIIIRPSRVGPEIVCKKCGCSNGELAREVCTRNREPGLVMA